MPQPKAQPSFGQGPQDQPAGQAAARLLLRAKYLSPPIRPRA